MAYESGCTSSPKTHTSCMGSSLPRLIGMREIGCLGDNGSISVAGRIQASSAFLPTKHNPRRLLKMRQKFFCGETSIITMQQNYYLGLI